MNSCFCGSGRNVLLVAWIMLLGGQLFDVYKRFFDELSEDQT